MTRPDAASRASTIARTKMFRRLRPTSAAPWRPSSPACRLLRRQDEQQSAVVVVRREEVGDRLGGKVSLGVDRDLLSERAHPPLERRLDRIGGAVAIGVGRHSPVTLVDPLEAEDVLDRAPDHVLISQAGELEPVLADVEDAALLVAGEERRLRGRVIVVEELEDEAEAALRAALRTAGDSRGPLARHFPVPAVRADEERHAESLARVPCRIRRRATAWASRCECFDTCRRAPSSG